MRLPRLVHADMRTISMPPSLRTTQALGWLPPDPAFAAMNGSRAWAIPWMEDDMSLASEELWVNRTLDHANQAAAMNVDGLLGLMWRTWETAPQISALAQVGWDVAAPLSDRDAKYASDAVSDVEGGKSAKRRGGTEGLSDVAFYKDFCEHNFGAVTSDECAALFLSLDGWNVAGKCAWNNQVVCAVLYCLGRTAGSVCC